MPTSFENNVSVGKSNFSSAFNFVDAFNFIDAFNQITRNCCDSHYEFKRVS